MVANTAPRPIPLQGISGLDRPLCEPKYLKTEMVYLANYYIVSVVENDVETFSYYPVKISKERKGNFYKFEVAPPVFKEGIVCVDKTFIDVPLNDLVRRNINVTRVRATRITKPEVTTIPADKRKTISTNESGIGNLFRDEDSKNIDMAFQDQIDALQYIEDAEEGLRRPNQV
jgi:hypothetical protein